MLSRVLLFLLSIALASADLLQNPDFESPPSNLPGKATSQFAALSNENNTIPGWTFQGNVMYVTSGGTITLPSDGHAVQLGEDAKINQTFVADNDLIDYVLTFTIAPGGENCLVEADLVVSAPDSTGVYSFKKKYGKQAWQSYGHYLGKWGSGESVDLEIHSQTSESDSSSVCWPLIDKLLLTNMPKLDSNDGNLLLNEGFEFGPEFSSNSSEGVLIDSAPSSVQSPLLGWSVLGTVRYIDSDHFFVPEGKSAIEIVSGVSSGIQTGVQLMEGSIYNLGFKLGDANNSCVRDFVVAAQAGSKAQNFTLASSGLGSAKNFSMSFRADSSATTISFISYTTGQTKDGNLCGPVIDDVVLSAASGASDGKKTHMQWTLLVSLLLLAINILYSDKVGVN